MTTPPVQHFVAREIQWHRRYSPIGPVQRHYTLEPLLLTERGVCSHGVVTIEGSRGTYAFASDDSGEIADFLAVAEAPAGISGAQLLAAMGYRVNFEPTIPTTVGAA